MQHQHATCNMQHQHATCAHTGAQRRCSDTCCRTSRSASTVSGLPSRPTRSALSVRRCECSRTPTPVRLRPPSLSGAVSALEPQLPSDSGRPLFPALSRFVRPPILVPRGRPYLRKTLRRESATSAPGLGRICAGTRPHLRRDSAASAPAPGLTRQGRRRASVTAPSSARSSSRARAPAPLAPYACHGFLTRYGCESPGRCGNALIRSHLGRFPLRPFPT
jgi:hypothetical protein